MGATVVVDFHLKIASASELVEVNAEPPVVETQRGSQANSVTQQYIADLPIGRRDYLTFTLLMPGVSDSTRLASDTDFRVKQTPQSGLSFYGSNGRGNSITVDGGEANDDAGGIRLTVSQDAVQEFQINRSNYSAELGGASGAALYIVTKSGTNETHGTLYGFFRNDAMDARNPFSFSQALHEEGLAMCQKVVSLCGSSPLGRALSSLILAMAGKTDEAQKILSELKGYRKLDSWSLILLAETCSVMGEKTEAFEFLEVAYQERGSWLVFLGAYRNFSNIRTDPRYVDLLRRMGLPQVPHPIPS